MGFLTIAGSTTQNLSAMLSPSDLSSYVGSSGTFNVSVSAGTAISSGTLSGPFPGDGQLFVGWGANSYGSVEIDCYSYIPIPETNTLFGGLAVLGMAGFSGIRRLRAIRC